MIYEPLTSSTLHHLSTWICLFLVWKVSIWNWCRTAHVWWKVRCWVGTCFSKQQEASSKKHVINLDHGNLIVDLAKAVEYIWIWTIVPLHTSNDLTRTASESLGIASMADFVLPNCPMGLQHVPPFCIMVSHRQLESNQQKKLLFVAFAAISMM